MQITTDDFLYFINVALDGMVRIVEELGDDRVNLRPDFPGANSPYVILYHCVGCTNFWIGALIAGRQVSRDRDAEFQAQGTVADIREAVRDLQKQLQEDFTHVQGDQPLAYLDALLPLQKWTQQQGVQHWRQGKALIHAYEELAQHHGQMEITRDILMQRDSTGSEK
ncbi:hypothetical protein D1AOALGA4SA_4339 [Olavius algarvensis Delta 1 endosymbiont]|nr:hypothetical protein D1AOALGA4SA_4339 [Olavius algarvensis Delta 1 endosymbiont]